MSGLLKKLFGGGEGDMSDQAQEMAAKAGGPQDMIDQASGLMDGGLPDPAEIQSAVDKLSPAELQSASQMALEMVPEDQRAQFGQMIQSYATKSGGNVPVPAGVASGNPTDMAAAVTGLLKGGGLDSLAGVFGGGGNGAATGGAGDVGGFDVGATLNNPIAKTVLAALIPAIMKAASGK